MHPTRHACLASYFKPQILFLRSSCTNIFSVTRYPPLFAECHCCPGARQHVTIYGHTTEYHGAYQGTFRSAYLGGDDGVLLLGDVGAYWETMLSQRQR